MTSNTAFSTLTAMSRDVIKDLLTDKENWIWEGKRKAKVPIKINHARLEGSYYRMMEAIYTDSFLLPTLYRAYKVFKLIKEGAFGGSYKDLEYVKTHFTTVREDDGTEWVDMVYGNCNCVEDLQMQLSENRFKGLSRSGRIRLCYSEWWVNHHPEFMYGTYVIAEIEALGIQPEFNYQPSLL